VTGGSKKRRRYAVFLTIHHGGWLQNGADWRLARLNIISSMTFPQKVIMDDIGTIRSISSRGKLGIG
jgi:hypothetical protein